MKYKYFISWTYEKGDGNSVVERTKKIRSFEDIKELQKSLEKAHGIEKVAIMNFIKLRKWGF